MFKKPFNRTIGETRQCKECNLEFFTLKPVYTCQPCQNKKQKVYEGRRRQQYQKKAVYPYQGKNHNYKQRFDPLKRILHKMKERSEWQTYFKVKLDEILKDAVLMKWIWDRRDDETKNANKSKSRNIIKKDYPDTRGHYEY
jgi:hypothetical protein